MVSTSTLDTLPSECYLLLLSTLNKEQLEAFMRTSKKLQEAYRFYEKRARILKSTPMSNSEQFEPNASPLPFRSWILAHEGDEDHF